MWSLFCLLFYFILLFSPQLNILLVDALHTHWRVVSCEARHGFGLVNTQKNTGWQEEYCIHCLCRFSNCLPRVLTGFIIFKWSKTMSTPLTCSGRPCTIFAKTNVFCFGQISGGYPLQIFFYRTKVDFYRYYGGFHIKLYRKTYNLVSFLNISKHQ